MKYITSLNLRIGVFAVLLSIAVLGSDDAFCMSSTVFVESPVYEFDPVVEGVKVTHEFLILNKGNTTLAIEKVRTG
ncbi:MAG: hypothetical protein JRK26_25145 [Deltaproteobacteria bacterium]|nr:hypothetical protein [Deltaproteobacteria bacterium]